MSANMRFKQFLSETIRISLRPSANLDAFLKEFNDETTPHPWARKLSIWQDKVMIELSKWQGNIHISSIMSLERKNMGNASACLKWLTELADKYQVKMDLDVQPIKNAGAREGKDLNKSQLKAWYKRHGFKPNGFKPVGGDHMLREPVKSDLSEAVVKPWKIDAMDVKKAVSLLNQHCSQGLRAIATGGLLFRGFKHDVAVMTIDPSQGERTSKDTNNVYQLMMDTSGALKDFPHRSKSLICSSNASEAASYGSPMVIIPFDGTKVVVSSKDDFIFNEIDTPWTDEMDVDAFSDNFEAVLGDESILHFRKVSDQRQMTAADIDHINAKIDNAPESFINSWLRWFPETNEEDFTTFITKNKGGVFQALSTALLTPETLSLRQVEFGNKLPANVECWFSGPCVAIDARVFAGILHALRQSGYKIHKTVERNLEDFFLQWPSLKAGELTDDAIQYIQDNLS